MQRYLRSKEQPPAFCLLPSASQPKADKSRIVNYKEYSEKKICSIGSGAVESAVKQIDRRTKISGAQWKKENVPQVLAHRCAYLNGQIV